MSVFCRKYNTLLVTGTTGIRIPLIKRSVVDFALGADWTAAAGDVKVFVDAAAVANITNLPTAIASGNAAFWEFILTAAELTSRQTLVVVSDAATKLIEDQAFIVETFGHASAMYVGDPTDSNIWTAQKEAAQAIVRGVVTTGGTTSSIPTSSLNPAASVADQFRGRIVIFDRATASANLRGQATDITASTAGGTLTVTALTNAPASGDTFGIY